MAAADRVFKEVINENHEVMRTGPDPLRLMFLQKEGDADVHRETTGEAQKKPAPPQPWAQTCAEIGTWCLCQPFCGSLLRQPEQTHASG